MITEEVKIYKLVPKTGYIFHSLENDEIYSDSLFMKDVKDYEGRWEEIPKTEDMNI